jgi:hypothetical protein
MAMGATTASDGSRPASRGLAGAVTGSRPATPLTVDLAEARQAHAAASQQLAKLQGQCSEQDKLVDANEAETQKILVGTW